MIIGQDQAVGRFLAAWRSGTPHHAWLLAGPKGVGKASFAQAAALRVLAEAAGPMPAGNGLDVDPDHPTARLIDAGSHPDFRRLERGMNKSGTALARNISVAQVRELGGLFAVTPSMSDWRVIVIDSADDLEASAANALLKMLEEPPANTLFFLVAHAPGRLLPTIRSRCRRLDFATLAPDDVARVIEQVRPATEARERERLAALAGGSAGRALAIAEHDLTPLAEAATQLMREGDPTNARRAALAKSLSSKAAAERYAIFLAMLPGIVAQEARGATGSRRAALLDAYAEARRTAQLAPRLSSDPASTVYVLTGHLAAAARQG
ncbi:DNA polymerase III subunit delta' [Sphingomicrobium astaxanthinifaciens]|uniref:DNA polymerase III subunit delta' n=1 Tax=Sphingomicrobium astaxanthinifaciens TaxID=1227949 RepID=UPI001FCAC73F|nr:DNA polymerase III subunit delta' [Sphingomicrobium astaxanthinifaciens]MCJ7422401.1 DNA polymerase III subunit delta' [Sphingomicrobium astaxanthinifaciens]